MNEAIPQVKMPRYQSHKQVHALKIAAIEEPKYEPGTPTDGSMIITPADEGYGPFPVDFAYLNKHDPQVGGYYVIYEDGYKSFSPAEPFEKGYTRI